MAFVDRVQDLTSLTVSDTDELSQFLRDGVIDVTNRWLAIRPQDIYAFAAVTAEQTSNGADLNSGKIISVVREAGTDNDWRSCRKIGVELQSRVTDTDSLHYASKYNPAYMEDENGKVSVFPVDVGTSQNAYKIYYVNNTPQDDNGVALAHDDTSIKYFPSDKVYLVIIYASMKLIQATMSAKSLSTFSVTAVPPDAPSAPSFTTVTVASTVAGALADIPTYTKPTYTAPTVGGTATELTEMTDLDTDNTIDVLANQPEFDQWFATASHLIEDEEDPELASAQLQKINSYISAWQSESTRRMQTYQADMQNELNEFNKENVAYQGKLQEVMGELNVAAAEAQKNADLDQQGQIAEYNSTLQKYQQDIAAYAADINAQVQEYSANIQEATTEYQWLQTQYIALKKEYDEAFGIMMTPKKGAR